MIHSRRLRTVRAGVILAATLALSAAGHSAFAANPGPPVHFTNGDLVVSRIATGTSGNGSAIFLDEYSTTGTLVSEIALPTANSGSNKSIVDSATATSEGAVSLSQDGRYVTIAGYNTTTGTPISNNASGAGGQNRVIAQIDYYGNVDTTTALTDAYTGSSSNIRSAVTSNGTNIYTTGAGATASQGIRITTDGTVGTSTQETGTSGFNTRVVNIYNNTLYFDTNTGIYSAGTFDSSGTFTAATPTKIATTTSSYDFYFSDPNTLYVADQTAGLEKFTANGGVFGSATVLNSSVKTLTGLTGITSGSTTTLFAVSPSTLYSLVDNGAISTLTSIAMSADVGGGSFRGLDLAPAPEPGQVAVMGLIGLGMAGLFLRARRARVSPANAA